MIDGPVIQTASGVYVAPMTPWDWTPDIHDIAWALSNLCRFTGHVRKFYSVCEHCCRVSDILPEEQKLAGLLHDASEAYLGDVASPLKKHPFFGAAYRDVEGSLQARIDDHFGVVSHSPEIRKADLILLATERRDLMPRDRHEWLILDGIEPLEDLIVPWSPEFARVAYMRRFLALAPVRVAA